MYHAHLIQQAPGRAGGAAPALVHLLEQVRQGLGDGPRLLDFKAFLLHGKLLLLIVAPNSFA